MAYLISFRRVRRLLLAVLCLAFLPALAVPADGDSWPGFRGPRVDGTLQAAAFTDPTAGLSLQTAWKVPIGSGYSGVAVAGGAVVTMFAHGEDDFVIALDRATGHERWRHKIGPTYAGHDGSHAGPLSTPLVVENRVFCLGPRGRLFSLDLESGRQAWSVNLVEKHGAQAPFYGFTTSPLFQDGVLVVPGGVGGAAAAGFDPATGDLKWSAGEDGIAHQSPVPFSLDGRRHVLVAANASLFGVEAATGEILWEYAHGGGGPRGAQSLVPVPAAAGRLFLAHKDDASTMIQVAHTDAGVVAEATWEGRTIRNSYSVAVHNDGYIYAFSSRILTCVDAATGETRWRSREPGDGFLILVDDHLVIVTKKGGVHVAKATPAGYAEVASLPVFVDDLAWSPPSFAGRSIYVRSLGELARIDLAAGSPSAAHTDVAATVSREDHAAKGSAFGRFVSAVGAAPASERAQKIDDFIAAQSSFPVIEGRGNVHFVYRGPGEDVAVASDLFGSRQERSMSRVADTDLFVYSAPLEADGRVNYLFIRDYEEILDPLNPRKTTTAVYGPDMEMSFSGAEMEMSWLAMPEWQEPEHLVVPEAARQGRLTAHTLESASLQAEHTVDVYVPVGYVATDHRYPVLYVHGGRDAQARGQLVRVLDNLIGRRVQPVVAVFINRGTGFLVSGAYTGMVTDELVPWVDETFRTIPEAVARVNLGSGLAGLAAIQCTLQKPDVFAGVAGQSAFVFETSWAQLKPLIGDATKIPLRVYLDWGKYDMQNPDEAWNLAASNRVLSEGFRERGYAVAGGEAHDGAGWSSWRNRTDDVLEALFPLDVAVEETVQRAGSSR